MFQIQQQLKKLCLVYIAIRTIAQPTQTTRAASSTAGHKQSVNQLRETSSCRQTAARRGNANASTRWRAIATTCRFTFRLAQAVLPAELQHVSAQEVQQIRRLSSPVTTRDKSTARSRARRACCACTAVGLTHVRARCALAFACLRLRACACVLAFACLRLRTFACVLALACFQTELQARKGARLGARAPQAQWFRTSLSPCAGLRFRGWRQRLPKRSQQRTRDPSTSSARQHRKYFLFGRRQRRRRRQNRDAAEPARAKGSRVLAGVQLFADRGRKRLPYRAGDASFPFQGLLKWTEHLRNVNNARAQRRATRRVRA